MALIDTINIFDNLNNLRANNENYEVEDYDDYVVVDNFAFDIQKFESSLLKFPFDVGHQVAEILYEHSDDKQEFRRPDLGAIQLYPNHYFDNYIRNIHEILVDTEYVPTTLEGQYYNQEYYQFLTTTALINGHLMYEGMIINENANFPCPESGEYTATLMFDNDTEDHKIGLNFWNFQYEDKSYSGTSEIMLEEEELQREIQDVLNLKCMVNNDLVKYEEVKDHPMFKKAHYIPSKRNRLVIWKSDKFTTPQFTENERYTFTCSFATPQCQQQQQQHYEE
jgi:hypothetical protein